MRLSGVAPGDPGKRVSHSTGRDAAALDMLVLSQVCMGANQTVLIAEDEADDGFLLQEAFRQGLLNPRVVWVRDGQEVLEYLCGKAPYDDRRQYPVPDLLLLDLKMPRVDGYGVLKWLQGRPALKIPVVVMTSALVEGDEVRTRELGAEEYHVKPLNFNELIRLVIALKGRWLKGKE